MSINRTPITESRRTVPITNHKTTSVSRKVLTLPSTYNYHIKAVVQLSMSGSTAKFQILLSDDIHEMNAYHNITTQTEMGSTEKLPIEEDDDTSVSEKASEIMQIDSGFHNSEDEVVANYTGMDYSGLPFAKANQTLPWANEIGIDRFLAAAMPASVI
ncbi:uncharacterized protein LOC100371089 [Saccoglossus kowalevskii]|uniref:Uncharacterized protein LOC100371089 n=1 Tax=Saccoglossus kowalevskii TaxID=10224 RepID=A0ABM0LUR1_SACKO|nr:PREDICTED: uncharacterized protein LOC100371089 [Saccoglossus kowalevskii]